MPYARRKKSFNVLAGAALAASLIVAPLVGSSASATDRVGEVGTLEEATPELNNTSYWESEYSEYDAQCYKHTGNSNAHGELTDDGLTVTLKEYDQSWHGSAWVVLVVKAGNLNNVIENPEAGVAYASPVNNGGQQAQVSHWIVCKGEKPDTPPEPTIVTPTLEFTLPTCDTAGTLTKSDDVLWTSASNDDGTTTWTAAPKDGTKFAPEAKTEWTVPDLDKLPASDEECRPDQPPAVVTTSDTSDLDCESTQVTVTTTTTTTPYVWDGSAWVPGEPTEEVTSAVRDMTAAEKKDCPVPTPTPTPTSTTGPAALAVTGGGISPLVPAAGGAVLLIGIAALTIAAYRRKSTAS